MAQITPDFQFDYEDASIIEGRGIGNPRTRDMAVTRLKRCLSVLDTLPAGSNVMEVGCGAGRQARTIKTLHPEFEVSGCDLSQRAIEEARAYKDGVDYRVSDAGELPYPDKSFDAVVLFDVLEHVPDPPQVIKEIARVLKKGGLFHGFIPIEGQESTLFRRLRHSKKLPISLWKRDRIGHIQQFTDSAIIGFFKEQGFEEVGRSYSFHLMGQLFDIADYWQRDRQAQEGLPLWRKKTAQYAAKLVMSPAWRLTYYEDEWRKKSNRATGLHLTCRKN